MYSLSLASCSANVARLVDKLHRAGFAHGEVELRHIVELDSCPRWNPDLYTSGEAAVDQWRLIDFDRAKQGPAAVENERSALQRSLRLVRWVGGNGEQR